MAAVAELGARLTSERARRRIAEPLSRADAALRTRRQSRWSRYAWRSAPTALLALAASGRRRRLVGERRPTLTPLGALTRGLAAGIAGNAAMDVTQTIVYKLRGKESGDWQSWDEAPGPAKIGKRVWEGVFQREAPEQKIGLFNNVVHYTYGPAWAGLYGLVEASLERPRPLRDGVAFGLFAWVMGSGVLMPAAKLAKPPWEYGPEAHAYDIGYHVAYGLGTAAAFQKLLRL